MKNILMDFKGALVNMAKVLMIRGNAKQSRSVLGKRKLDYRYSGFISSARRPPLASPKLEENSGVKYNGKVRKS